MNNKIVQANPYGKLVKEELVAFEKKIGAVLPEPYREYLVKYNGAKFESDILFINEDEGETRLHHRYALVKEPYYASLFEQYKTFKKVLKNEYLPICDDGVGNQILIKLNEQDRGSIYFWDHEMPFKQIEKILIKVADSFTDFVDNLKKDETADETIQEELERYKKENPEFYELYLNALKEREEI